MLYSVDEGCDVGEDSGAPVSADYGPRANGFNGRIKGAQLDIPGADSLDHLVKPEGAIRIALAQH